MGVWKISLLTHTIFNGLEMRERGPSDVDEGLS